MKAVQFEFSVPRWAFTKAAGALSERMFYSRTGCIQLRDIPEPVLPGPRWVKLRSVLSGFCGSDIGAVMLHDSPTAEPFASFPFVLGHENCSIVEEVGGEVTGIEPGERVTILPPLGCAAREIEPPCGPCLRGEVGNCENFAEGSIRPGIDIGFCADTGGGWSKYYLAPESNVVKVPDALTDEQVVIMESLCSSLHPVSRVRPKDGDRVLVIGCGVLGLGVVASIRALGIDCRITGLEPVRLNQEKALEKGADEIIDPTCESIYERTAGITGAKVYKPALLEKQLCMGGFDCVFDCVGSTRTIYESLRVAANGGRVALIGINTPKRVDWTPVWLKGLTIVGCHAEGVDEHEGRTRTTFELAIDLVLAGRVDLADLITHRFLLDEYRKAIEVNMHKARYGAIKTIFDLSAE